MRGVGAVVEVAEGDQPVAVDIHERRSQRGRDLLLVQPDVEVEIDMPVVDAGIDHADDGGGRPQLALRPGLAGLAAEGIRHGRGIAVHPPQAATGVAGVVADRRDRDLVVGFGEGDPGLRRKQRRRGGGIEAGTGRDTHQHAVIADMNGGRMPIHRRDRGRDALRVGSGFEHHEDVGGGRRQLEPVGITQAGAFRQLEAERQARSVEDHAEPCDRADRSSFCGRCARGRAGLSRARPEIVPVR